MKSYKTFKQEITENADSGITPAHRQGAQHAENLIKASNRFSETGRKRVDLQIMKGRGKKFVNKGGPKVSTELERVSKEHEENSKAYSHAQSVAKAHKETHGHDVVSAWEKVHGKKWPHYKL